jgi:DNA repair protein RadC
MYKSIKYWAEDDRPREKLILKGRSACSDAELLAILLGSGTRELSALELSREVLQKAGNDLHVFSRMGIKELCATKGIGEAKAVTILAALELGRRRKELEKRRVEKITSSQQVYSNMRRHLQDLMHEEFWVILLNRANEIIKTLRVSSGGLSGTVADGKMIFRMAIEEGAHGMILVHNHPSGQKHPSDNDKQLTRKMVEFGRYIDLQVLDHVIYTDHGYYSFADEGKL